MTDIRNYPKVIETINALINAKGIAEVKIEKSIDGEKIVVVEQKRYVVMSRSLTGKESK